MPERPTVPAPRRPPSLSDAAVSGHEIRDAVRAAGMCGRPVCVHASLRSFGRVRGGASTVVGALLAEGCTVLVPTFSWVFLVDPPPGQRPARNDWDDDSPPAPTRVHGRTFAPDSLDLDVSEMGAVPAAVLAAPEHVRGNHPLSSFSAIGPLADDLVAGQSPLDVFAPLQALAERGGVVVLMGVGLNRMTLLHLAEQMAGRGLFRRWANGPDGEPVEVETGGCSEGFERLAPLLAALEQRIEVGKGTWRVYPARDTLEVAAKVIRDSPALTHCGGRCVRCDDAVLGGPILATACE